MRISGCFLLAMASLSFAASGQVLQTKTYSTSGHPVQALETPDGQYVLVTVMKEGVSGIDIFKKNQDTLERVAFQPLGQAKPQGILLLPNSKILAVGVSNAGVALLPLDPAIQGTAQPRVIAQGQGAGSGSLAVSPDGQQLFVANEYGNGGNVGVIHLSRDEKGMIHPETVAHIPTGQATPGVTVSPDGKRMYAVGEVISQDFAVTIPGHENRELQHGGCQQAGPRTMQNGALWIVDAEKTAAWQADGEKPLARVGRSNAGCSPVRVAVSADSKLVFVTARGDNRIMVFDAARFADEGPSALVASFPSGGDAPVGLMLFDHDTRLLVANSNRFSGGSGSAAVIDVSDPTKAKVLQKIKTGDFPRNIAASPDGKTLYMTIFLGDELMVLREK